MAYGVYKRDHGPSIQRLLGQRWQTWLLALFVVGVLVLVVPWEVANLSVLGGPHRRAAGE